MVIPSRFISDNDETSLLDFCLEIIEQVSDYCCSVKPNTQYFLGAYNILKRLVRKIHDEGMLAILDHKLSDIGSSNESAIFWIADIGFDAFTYSPFPGNIQDTVNKSHDRGLGVIVLTLMSNPEAEDLMLKTVLHGQPYYLSIARAVANAQADGCVVGLTGFVRDEYIKNIQDIVGDHVILLMQGIGPQGGNITKVKYVKNPLISLGREVIYSANPKLAVKEYHERLDRLRVPASLH
jgi:orotidine-5'-phosphate decarboxylase